MAYFANSTEGDVLSAQCYDCPLGAGWENPAQTSFDFLHREDRMRPCPVASVQLQYNYDQLKKGNEQLRDAMNLLIDETGKCLVRRELQEIRSARLEK